MPCLPGLMCLIRMVHRVVVLIDSVADKGQGGLVDRYDRTRSSKIKPHFICATSATEDEYGRQRRDYQICAAFSHRHGHVHVPRLSDIPIGNSLEPSQQTHSRDTLRILAMQSAVVFQNLDHSNVHTISAENFEERLRTCRFAPSPVLESAFGAILGPRGGQDVPLGDTRMPACQAGEVQVHQATNVRRFCVGSEFSPTFNAYFTTAGTPYHVI